MPKVALKIFTLLVVPVVVAVIAQAAAAAKPYHARVKDRVAARGQLWMSSPNGVSIGGTTLGNTVGMGSGARVNDPNVYRDGQPIPYYDINPHGG
jgi:hypothetical protein